MSAPHPARFRTSYRTRAALQSKSSRRTSQQGKAAGVVMSKKLTVSLKRGDFSNELTGRKIGSIEGKKGEGKKGLINSETKKETEGKKSTKKLSNKKGPVLTESDNKKGLKRKTDFDKKKEEKKKLLGEGNTDCKNVKKGIASEEEVKKSQADNNRKKNIDSESKKTIQGNKKCISGKIKNQNSDCQKSNTELSKGAGADGEVSKTKESSLNDGNKKKSCTAEDSAKPRLSSPAAEKGAPDKKEKKKVAIESKKCEIEGKVVKANKKIKEQETKGEDLKTKPKPGKTEERQKPKNEKPKTDIKTAKDVKRASTKPVNKKKQINNASLPVKPTRQNKNIVKVRTLSRGSKHVLKPRKSTPLLPKKLEKKQASECEESSTEEDDKVKGEKHKATVTSRDAATKASKPKDIKSSSLQKQSDESKGSSKSISPSTEQDQKKGKVKVNSAKQTSQDKDKPRGSSPIKSSHVNRDDSVKRPSNSEKNDDSKKGKKEETKKKRGRPFLKASAKTVCEEDCKKNKPTDSSDEEEPSKKSSDETSSDEEERKQSRTRGKRHKRKPPLSDDKGVALNDITSEESEQVSDSSYGFVCSKEYQDDQNEEESSSDDYEKCSSRCIPSKKQKTLVTCQQKKKKGPKTKKISDSSEEASDFSKQASSEDKTCVKSRKKLGRPSKAIERNRSHASDMKRAESTDEEEASSRTDTPVTKHESKSSQEESNDGASSDQKTVKKNKSSITPKIKMAKFRRRLPMKVAAAQAKAKARNMKVFGFWGGPKRHRVASLNASAKVQCLYESENKSPTSSSSSGGSSSSDGNESSSVSDDEDANDQDVKYRKQKKEDPGDGSAMRDMTGRKRMASLNASAILAASYRYEKKPKRTDRLKDDDEDDDDDSFESSSGKEDEEDKKSDKLEVNIDVMDMDIAEMLKNGDCGAKRKKDSHKSSSESSDKDVACEKKKMKTVDASTSPCPEFSLEGDLCKDVEVEDVHPHPTPAVAIKAEVGKLDVTIAGVYVTSNSSAATNVSYRVSEVQAYRISASVRSQSETTMVSSEMSPNTRTDNSPSTIVSNEGTATPKAYSPLGALSCLAGNMTGNAQHHPPPHHPHPPTHHPPQQHQPPPVPHHHQTPPQHPQHQTPPQHPHHQTPPQHRQHQAPSVHQQPHAQTQHPSTHHHSQPSPQPPHFTSANLPCPPPYAYPQEHDIRKSPSYPYPYPHHGYHYPQPHGYPPHGSAPQSHFPPPHQQPSVSQSTSQTPQPPHPSYHPSSGHSPHSSPYHQGFYQPAGPLIQSSSDPCHIHKPVPQHPELLRGYWHYPPPYPYPPWYLPPPPSLPLPAPPSGGSGYLSYHHERSSAYAAYHHGGAAPPPQAPSVPYQGCHSVGAGSYSCSCSVQSCPKNVHAGPLTGEGKGSVNNLHHPHPASPQQAPYPGHYSSYPSGYCSRDVQQRYTAMTHKTQHPANHLSTKQMCEPSRVSHISESRSSESTTIRHKLPSQSSHSLPFPSSHKSHENRVEVERRREEKTVFCIENIVRTDVNKSVSQECSHWQQPGCRPYQQVPSTCHGHCCGNHPSPMRQPSLTPQAALPPPSHPPAEEPGRTATVPMPPPPVETTTVNEPKVIDHEETAPLHKEEAVPVEYSEKVPKVEPLAKVPKLEQTNVFSESKVDTPEEECKLESSPESKVPKITECDSSIEVNNNISPRTFYDRSDELGHMNVPLGKRKVYECDRPNKVFKRDLTNGIKKNFKAIISRDGISEKIAAVEYTNADFIEAVSSIVAPSELIAAFNNSCGMINNSCGMIESISKEAIKNDEMFHSARKLQELLPKIRQEPRKRRKSLSETSDSRGEDEDDRTSSPQITIAMKDVMPSFTSLVHKPKLNSAEEKLEEPPFVSFSVKNDSEVINSEEATTNLCTNDTKVCNIVQDCVNTEKEATQVDPSNKNTPIQDKSTKIENASDGNTSGKLPQAQSAGKKTNADSEESEKGSKARTQGQKKKNVERIANSSLHTSAKRKNDSCNLKKVAKTKKKPNTVKLDSRTNIKKNSKPKGKLKDVKEETDIKCKSDNGKNSAKSLESNDGKVTASSSGGKETTSASVSSGKTCAKTTSKTPNSTSTGVKAAVSAAALTASTGDKEPAPSGLLVSVGAKTTAPDSVPQKCDKKCDDKKKPKKKKGAGNTRVLRSKAKKLKDIERTRAVQPRRTLKPKWSIGWQWQGEPKKSWVHLSSEGNLVIRTTYPAMRHDQGDVIQVRDCVLLKSGSTEAPFVAKIAALWEDPDDGEMMMSVVWYYRPEHTETSVSLSSNSVEYEIFGSRHRDVNSVACVEDKCFVLTFNEYCRYRRWCCGLESGVDIEKSVVPVVSGGYPRAQRLPPARVAPDRIFFCQRVYDFRQKRILKNPG